MIYIYTTGGLYSSKEMEFTMHGRKEREDVWCTDDQVMLTMALL